MKTLNTLYNKSQLREWHDLCRMLLVVFLSLYSFPAIGQVIAAVGGASAKQAVSSAGGKNQFMLGETLMFFTNESTQNKEKLPGGTTIYSQTNIQYNLVDKLFGFGMIYQHDKIGPNQTNNGILLKGELTWNGYYFELGYGTADQKFSERAVSSRTGTQMLYGGGIRVPFLHEFLYFDGGVRKRTSTFTKQDGVKMSHPLSESLMMPYIGLGISL